MKLFQRLLVAPALLGFIVPVTAKATETNLDAISNYYQDNIDLNSKSFISNPENKTLLLSGGEGLVESSSSDPVVDDSFSSTTSASFGSTFYVGAVDGGTVTVDDVTSDAEAVTFSYDFAMDLSTSFTGEDSLDIAVIGGNASGTAVDDFMGGDGTSDELTLDGVSYTFPLGGATVIVGDGVGVDDLNTGACAYSALSLIHI